MSCRFLVDTKGNQIYKGLMETTNTTETAMNFGDLVTHTNGKTYKFLNDGVSRGRTDGKVSVVEQRNGKDFGPTRKVRPETPTPVAAESATVTGTEKRDAALASGFRVVASWVDGKGRERFIVER